MIHNNITLGEPPRVRHFLQQPHGLQFSCAGPGQTELPNLGRETRRPERVAGRGVPPIQHQGVRCDVQHVQVHVQEWQPSTQSQADARRGQAGIPCEPDNLGQGHL